MMKHIRIAFLFALAVLLVVPQMALASSHSITDQGTLLGLYIVGMAHAIVAMSWPAFAVEAQGALHSLGAILFTHGAIVPLLAIGLAFYAWRRRGRRFPTTARALAQ